MTKQLMTLIDSTLASTGRTVRAVVLILTIVIATGAAPNAEPGQPAPTNSSHAS